MLGQFVANYYEWIVSATIGFVTFCLVRFYVKVLTLPKGPFPYPLIGNILIFRGTKENQFVTIQDLAKKYGSVFTLWLGNSPMVLINDFDLAKQGFNSKGNELNDRPGTIMREMVTQGKGEDVVFGNHGPIWASLRRVAHSAVRKLAISEKLSELVSDSVDQTVDTIKKKEGINNAFDPNSYISLSVFNILASSAFGTKYSIDDKEFNYFKDSIDYFRNNSNDLAIVDRIPILKPFYLKSYNKLSAILTDMSQKIRNKYLERLNNHKKGVVNDFCDGLIEAKEEAIIEAKESAPDLTDFNLSLVIFDLFFAGSDTTQYMMRWIVLFIANNTDMQSKMRREIEDLIGDRVTQHEDKSKCHYVNAFIAETLRYRPVAPLGVPHNAKCDTKIGNFKILKNTIITPNIINIHNDVKYWDKPEIFDPTRFLSSNGEFNASKHKAFIPFGIGRRVCLGEKLALADLFLITVRLLQATSGYTIALPDGNGSADLTPNPNIPFLCVPNPYKVMLKK